MGACECSEKKHVEESSARKNRVNNAFNDKPVGRKEPAGGPRPVDEAESKDDESYHVEGEHFHLRMAGSTPLDAVWMAASANGGGPALSAIVFYGPADCDPDIDHTHESEQWAHFYHKQGFNVLLVYMRREEGVGEGESGLYHDAAVAVGYVEDKGVPKDKIIAHGFSLGGALAAAAAAQHDLAALILDHTFSTVPEVVEVGGSTLPPWLVDACKNGAYPAGNECILSKQRQGNKEETVTVFTDGLSNTHKVGQFPGFLCVIYGTEDKMMTSEFGDKLLWAHTGAHTHFAIPDGTHTTKQFYDDKEIRVNFSQSLLWHLSNPETPQQEGK